MFIFICTDVEIAITWYDSYIIFIHIKSLAGKLIKPRLSHICPITVIVFNYFT